MPTYQVGDQTVRRKNLYMPCVIGPIYDEASEEEQARILKATWWADNITASEWPVVLKEDKAKPYAKSRLKKKMVGWLMALGRIAYLNNELFADSLQSAFDLYEEQTREPHPLKVAFSRFGYLFFHDDDGKLMALNPTYTRHIAVLFDSRDDLEYFHDDSAGRPDDTQVGEGGR